MASLGAPRCAALAVLVAATLLASASAVDKPPRRLLGTDTGIGGFNFKSNYVDTCYDTRHALIENWAIKFMCEQVKEGNSDTWIMELEDPKCITKGDVKVTIGANGEPIVTGNNVCKTVKHKVEVDKDQCAVLFNPDNKACRGYLSDRSPPNIGNTWALLTVHEIPEPTLSPTVRFQVALEAACGSLNDPEFKGWLAVGEVFQGEPCNGAKYGGEDTLPPVPFFIEGKSYPKTPTPVIVERLPANLPAKK